ncbi:hypothetical protein IIA95_02210, partial [Patescibacteria group bacterium]|nr:hypothetical protein [Patescibacteria group bacterium]
MMVRHIGIRHRVKQTVKGEAHPTQVAIRKGEKAIRLLNLKTDEDELDFVVGRFPTRWRVADPDEDFSGIFPRHVRRRKKRGSEEFEIVIPRENSYEGFQKGDIVTMALGGSGDKLAYASSRQAEKIGAEVLRIPPFVLMERRETYGCKKDDPEEDARILAELVHKNPGLFYSVTIRDRRLILVRETYRARVRAMKARITCQQRLRQRLIGKIFCSEDGLYPEGAIEDLFKAEKANDEELRLHVKKEKALIKELKKALENLDIYTKLFKPIEGCGPVLAAPLISEICDIRRFET